MADPRTLLCTPDTVENATRQYSLAKDLMQQALAPLAGEHDAEDMDKAKRAAYEVDRIATVNEGALDDDEEDEDESPTLSRHKKKPGTRNPVAAIVKQWFQNITEISLLRTEIEGDRAERLKGLSELAGDNPRWLQDARKQSDALLADPLTEPEEKVAIRTAITNLNLAFIIVKSKDPMTVEQAQAQMGKGV